MRVLLDTHILLWVLRDAPELKPDARRLLEHAETVYVSSVSLWEAAIKSTLGKLSLTASQLEAEASAIGLLPLSVTWRHAVALNGLPLLHRDPFDRMLVAQAICEPMHLVTSDALLKPYSDLVTVV